MNDVVTALVIVNICAVSISFMMLLVTPWMHGYSQLLPSSIGKTLTEDAKQFNSYMTNIPSSMLVMVILQHYFGGWLPFNLFLILFVGYVVCRFTYTMYHDAVTNRRKKKFSLTV